MVLLSVSAPAILAASLSLAIKLNLNYIEMGLFVTAAVGGLFDLGGILGMIRSVSTT